MCNILVTQKNRAFVTAEAEVLHRAKFKFTAHYKVLDFFGVALNIGFYNQKYC